jgi:hypothetical protein
MKYNMPALNYFTIEEKEKVKHQLDNIVFFADNSINLITSSAPAEIICFDLEQLEENLKILKNTLKIKEVA